MVEPLCRTFILLSVIHPYGIKLLEGSKTTNGLHHHVPKVCTQSPLTATYHKSTEAWYYSNNAGRCKSVPPRSCVDGGNSFPTLRECKKRCQPIYNTKPEICLMVAMHTCGERYPAWSFDITDRHCKMLEHTACRGKIMVFPSETVCQAICLPHQMPKAICSWKAYPQKCSAFHNNRWFFSLLKGVCATLPNNLCVRSGNSFPTHAACMERCSYHAHGTHSSNHPWRSTNELPQGKDAG